VRQLYHVIEDILVSFVFATGEIIIPRLEDWISIHAVDNWKRDKYIPICILEDDDETLFTLKCGDRRIAGRRGQNHRLEIVSIAGIPSAREIKSVHGDTIDESLPGATDYMLEKKLFIRDIKQSKPESWWLFRFRSDLSDWYFVNYGEGRMYSGCEDGTCGLHWNDSGDVHSWRTFTELESNGMYSNKEV
jgi:hypothetical protein